MIRGSHSPLSIMSLQKLALLFALLILNACSLEPTYKKPEIEVPARFSTDLWQVAQPQAVDVTDAWWQLFKDPVLDELEPQIDVNNQTLKVAIAKLLTAKGVLDTNSASLFPSFGMSVGDTRAHNAQTTNSNGINSVNAGTVNTYTLSSSISWDADLWGRLSSTVNQSRAQLQVNRDDLFAARLSLQISLAQTYFALRSAELTGKALQRAVEENSKFLQLTESSYAAGVSVSSDVSAAKSQLKTSQAQLLDQEILRSQYEHAIAVLLGKIPGDFHLAKAYSLPNAPDVPLIIPSSILQRRPDIASAERSVAAANAAIGVATAAFFPNITLTGTGGWRGNFFSTIVNSAHQFWSYGPAFAITGLNPLAYQGVKAQAMGNLAQVTATYRQTVLNAFQEIEDNLVALSHLREEVKIQSESLEAARKTLQVTTDQYKAGTVSYLNVVSAQTTALSAENTLISVRNRQLIATGVLLKNAAGRWDMADVTSMKNPLIGATQIK